MRFHVLTMELEQTVMGACLYTPTIGWFGRE
jgi:hypothetical protein